MIGAWVLRRACGADDADLFFSGDEVDVASAVAICEGCPVRDECLDYALEHNIDDGVWGGATEAERRRMRRARRTARPKPTTCAHCGGPMPADALASRVTCSGRCRRERLAAQSAASSKRWRAAS